MSKAEALRWECGCYSQNDHCWNSCWSIGRLTQHSQNLLLSCLKTMEAPAEKIRWKMCAGFQCEHTWCVKRWHRRPFVVKKDANPSCELLLNLDLSLISQTTKRKRAASSRKIVKVSLSLLHWGQTLDHMRACWLNTLWRFSRMEPGLIGLMQGSTTEPLPLGKERERQTWRVREWEPLRRVRVCMSLEQSSVHARKHICGIKRACNRSC